MPTAWSSWTYRLQHPLATSQRDSSNNWTNTAGRGQHLRPRRNEMDLVKLVPIADLDISGHYRKHMGDLDKLADSIDRLGLLHPIVIAPDNRLIAGLRRYQACKDVLGWTEILCRVLDLDSILAGQYAENEVRKDFTPSER